MPGMVAAVSWEGPFDSDWTEALHRMLPEYSHSEPCEMSRFVLPHVYIGVAGHGGICRVDACDGHAVGVWGEVVEGDLARNGAGAGVAAALAARVADRREPAVLEGLDGQSAAFCWCGPDQTLHAVTDRHGGIPIYVWEPPGATVLATRMLSLTGLPGFRGRLSIQGAVDLLTVGCCIGKRTLYSDVEFVEGGHHLTWRRGTRSVTRYWQPMYRNGEKRGSIDDCADELAERIRDAVGRRAQLRGVHSVSAGYDSRVLAAAAVDVAGPEMLTSYTIGPTASYDGRYGAAVSQALGIPHTRIDAPEDFFARYADEGMRRVDGMVIGHTCWRMAADSFLRRHRDHILINGNGGDFFHGSAFLKKMRAAPSDGEAFDAYFRESVFWRAADMTVLSGVLRPDVDQATKNVTFGMLKERFLAVDTNERLSRLDTVSQYTLSARRYARMNFDYSAAILRTYQPFRTNAILDFQMAMPADYREDARVYRRMIQRHWPNVARVVYSGTGLPIASSGAQRLVRRAAGTWRYKVLPWVSAGRYVPANPGTYVYYLDWLRSANRRYVSQLLIEQDHLSALCDGAAVGRFVRSVLEGRSGHYGLVYNLASLARFCRDHVS